MDKLTLLNIIYYTVLAMVVGAFYISLRTETHQLEYGLIALALWTVAYLVSRALKKEKSKLDH